MINTGTDRACFPALGTIMCVFIIVEGGGKRYTVSFKYTVCNICSLKAKDALSRGITGVVVFAVEQQPLVMKINKDLTVFRHFNVEILHITS